MKKPSKLALYALTASFFVVTTPLDASYFPYKENSLEEIALRCAVSEHPDTAKTHTPEEISNIISEVYEHTFNEPDYFSEKLVREVIQQESGNDPNAVSSKGAKGLMQIKRIAWNEVEKECSYEENVLDPRINIEAGTKYLLALDKSLRRDHPRWKELSIRKKREAILASYNGGKSRLAKSGWNVGEMPRETQLYVRNIDEGLGD